MSKIATNPEKYTVGIPNFFFMEVSNPDDPQATDHMALARAYAGITDSTTGTVLNSADMDTCLTPEQIIADAYIGNITSASMAGDVKTVEHTSSVNGRKEIDKVVLIRRSLTYTLGVDEMDDRNLARMLSAKKVINADTGRTRGFTTARVPQATQADFTVGDIQIVTNGLTEVGDKSSSLELLVTDSLLKNNASMAPYKDGATDYYIGGVFYFVVGDYQRFPDIAQSLERYRNKILCGFFKYDATTRMMKLAPWPSGAGAPGVKYPESSFDSRVRVFTEDAAETVIGVRTNYTVNDGTQLSSSLAVNAWGTDGALAASHTTVMSLGGPVSRGTLTITISGKKFDSGLGTWNVVSEQLRDVPMMATASGDKAPIATVVPIVAPAYEYTSQLLSSVDYKTGEVTLALHPDFLLNATTNGIDVQTLDVAVSANCATSAAIMWNGVTWVLEDGSNTVLRVNRGKSELIGTAIVVHHNSTGVSYVQMIPRAALRPDGGTDFSKDDWLKGSFILSLVKRDGAVFPNLPRRLAVPFGMLVTYKHRETAAN